MRKRKRITSMTEAALKIDSTEDLDTNAANANTPMLRQYHAEKKKHPDTLLFFRLGDFYELFYDDAVTTAKALQITLTQRGKGDNAVPMCGVPFHAYEHYVKKLIEQGYKVAICEQTETPEDRIKNGGKGPLTREVVRVITPGTVVESAFLQASQHNFLCAVAYDLKGRISLALLDLSSSLFKVESGHIDDLLNFLSKYAPKEILIHDKLYENCFDALLPYRRAIQPLPSTKWNADNAKNRILNTYKIATFDALGDFETAEIQAIGTILDYIDITHKEALISIPFPKKNKNQKYLIIDHQTRANLEVDYSSKGKYEGSLTSVLDQTITNGGARLLRRYLAEPLQDLDILEKRLDAITYFYDRKEVVSQVRSIQNKNFDLTRSLSRILMRKASAADLAQVRGALQEGLLLKDIFTQTPPFEIPSIPQSLLDLLSQAIVEAPPTNFREGGFIQEGFNEKLDELRSFAAYSEQHLEALQEQYKQAYQIPTLRIKSNNLAGYFIEIPSSQRDKIPAEFIHKQTLASNIRYTTRALDEIASKIQSASIEALQLEFTLFDGLLDDVAKEQESLFFIANFLAEVDLFASQAHLAHAKNYVRPQLSSDNNLEIIEGRHPVLDSSQFIANDTCFDEKRRFYLLTGPNMAGKSTYLRQTALITLMAHVGFYVPATKANIGITDRIFSRIGAGDDLASGRSTFMVEMIETATILNQATDRSLVILDELGRGTSTFDGLSLAWAVSETLENLGCRTLFATHYFELTELAATLPTFENLRLAVKEWEGKIHFLHKVEQGAANRSYGLHVASLAGVPKKIIDRAQEILLELEKGHHHIKPERRQLSLDFVSSTKPAASHVDCKIRDSLKELDIDHLTPLKALTLLHEWKKLL